MSVAALIMIYSLLAVLPDPTIILSGDPIPYSIISHIVERTNGFCQEKHKTNVEHIKLKCDAAKQDTQVIYRCANQ